MKLMFVTTLMLLAGAMALGQSPAPSATMEVSVLFFDDEPKIEERDLMVRPGNGAQAESFVLSFPGEPGDARLVYRGEKTPGAEGQVVLELKGGATLGLGTIRFPEPPLPHEARSKTVEIMSPLSIEYATRSKEGLWKPGYYPDVGFYLGQYRTDVHRLRLRNPSGGAVAFDQEKIFFRKRGQSWSAVQGQPLASIAVGGAFGPVPGIRFDRNLCKAKL